jgi:serine/threonine protein kinase
MAEKHSARTQITRLTPVDQDRTVTSPAASTNPGPRPTIPDVELGEEIGRGGMGVVYKGRQSYIDRQVAVKLLLVDKVGGDEFLKRFQREAKILAGLAHPHIVACYQAGVTAEGNPFLVMEYIEGPNLRDWLNQQGAMTGPQALALVRDLAQALEHASGQGIIHRDVKPENVLLQMREQAQPGDAFPYQVKLVDLGLARPVGTGGQSSLTLQGVVMGTPATMAPEQFEDPDHVDFRADMYGLGCVLYHALTGQPAFASPTLAQIVTAKMSGPIPDPSQAVGGLSRPVNDLARTLLARDKAQRPASYQALITRCDQLLVGTASSGGSSPMLRYALGLVTVIVAIAVWMAVSTASHPSLPVSPPPAALTPSVGATSAPAAPAAIASVAAANSQPAVFGPAQPLSRIEEWKKAGDAAWDRSETEDAALSGVAGEIDHALEPGLWRIEATLVLENGDIKTDSAAIGIVSATGERFQVQIANLGAELRIGVDTYNDGKIGDSIASALVKAQKSTVHVIFRHESEQFIEFEAGDKPLAKPLGLPKSALPLKAVYLLVQNNSAHGERAPVTVRQMTVQYAK